jgi:two-component system sensor histidine kinase YesM
MKYEIDIPDEIGQFYILKLLLQPLVENALYHGIKIKRGGGIIKVSAKEDNGYLEFSVKDTGCGMTPEQLEALIESMKKEKPKVSEGGTGGFGLVNVNMRLRLYYNEPEGLKITSGPEGTDVRFRVPCRTKEEIFENESISG